MKRMPGFLLLCLFAFLPACVSTQPLNALPKDPESFLLPRAELQEKFSEIEEYSKKFRGFSTNTPLAKQLTDNWGQPDEIRKNFAYLLGMGGSLVGAGILISPVPAFIAGGALILIRPGIPEYYYWKKGNFCIEAYIDKTIPASYEQTMIYWHWYELADLNLPEQCTP